MERKEAVQDDVVVEVQEAVPEEAVLAAVEGVQVEVQEVVPVFGIVYQLQEEFE